MARRTSLALLLAVLVAGWAVAAWLLWQTRVPDGLRLPEVAAEDVLGPAQLDEARDYERFARLNLILSFAALIVVFALYARYGARFVRESAAGRIGTGMLLGMLGFAILWLAQLPFGVADLWWQRRHDISRVGYVEFLNQTRRQV